MCGYVKMKLHIRCTPKERKIKVKPWETHEYLVLKMEKWPNEINIYFNFPPNKKKKIQLPCMKFSF